MVVSEVAERELRAYFESSGFICPWARSVVKQFVHEAELGREALVRVVGALEAGDAVVALPSREGQDFCAARVWCCRVFMQLALIADPDGDLNVSWLISKSEARLLPFLPLGDVTAYAIGLGPQYPEHHPRRAPRLCLVLVNEARIREAPRTARLAVQAEMAARTGVVYDADHVWLPLEPRPKACAAPFAK